MVACGLAPRCGKNDPVTITSTATDGPAIAQATSMRINLPNQITLVRLVLAIVFCYLLTRFNCRLPHQQSTLVGWTLAIFVIAALSDILDGWLARRSNQVTTFGRVVDPFVDKMLVCGGFVLLLGRNFVDDKTGQNVAGVEAWMVVVILGRELLVTGLRGISESQGSQFAANALGKLKMWVQCMTIGWILLTLIRPGSHPLSLQIRQGWIWATILITVGSLAAYLVQARNALARQARA